MVCKEVVAHSCLKRMIKNGDECLVYELKNENLNAFFRFEQCRKKEKEKEKEKRKVVEKERKGKFNFLTKLIIKEYMI